MTNIKFFAMRDSQPDSEYNLLLTTNKDKKLSPVSMYKNVLYVYIGLDKSTWIHQHGKNPLTYKPWKRA